MEFCRVYSDVRAVLTDDGSLWDVDCIPWEYAGGGAWARNIVPTLLIAMLSGAWMQTVTKIIPARCCWMQ